MGKSVDHLQSVVVVNVEEVYRLQVTQTKSTLHVYFPDTQETLVAKRTPFALFRPSSADIVISRIPSGSQRAEPFASVWMDHSSELPRRLNGYVDMEAKRKSSYGIELREGFGWTFAWDGLEYQWAAAAAAGGLVLVNLSDGCIACAAYSQDDVRCGNGRETSTGLIEIRDGALGVEHVVTSLSVALLS